MYTPEEKDAILLKMISDDNRNNLAVGPKYVDRDFKFLSPLIRQFSRRGFITTIGQLGKSNDTFTVTVELDADDFLSRGGFKFEEEIFMSNLHKLELEIKDLQASNPEINFKPAAELIGAVAAGMDIYKHLGG